MSNKYIFFILSIVLSIISAQPEMIASNQYNIAGGLDYSMAVNSDRTLTVWGSYSDQNGNIDNVSNVFSIARGYHHTGVLFTDGTVGYYGDNGEGNPENIPDDFDWNTDDLYFEDEIIIIDDEFVFDDTFTFEEIYIDELPPIEEFDMEVFEEMPEMEMVFFEQYFCRMAFGHPH